MLFSSCCGNGISQQRAVPKSKHNPNHKLSPGVRRLNSTTTADLQLPKCNIAMSHSDFGSCLFTTIKLTKTLHGVKLQYINSKALKVLIVYSEIYDQKKRLVLVQESCKLNQWNWLEVDCEKITSGLCFQIWILILFSELIVQLYSLNLGHPKK